MQLAKLTTSLETLLLPALGALLLVALSLERLLIAYVSVRRALAKLLRRNAARHEGAPVAPAGPKGVPLATPGQQEKQKIEAHDESA